MRKAVEAVAQKRPMPRIGGKVELSRALRKLKPRERDVVGLVTARLMNKQIAGR
jgi:FixJ family two-component response regulator